MPDYQANVLGRVRVAGTFECRDATGKVLGTFQLDETADLTTPEQVAAAQQLIKESTSGTDHRA